MIPVISVKNMRESDALTIASGVESKLLMYRAAYGIYQTISWDGSVVIAVGSGNNGGDGFALACILKVHGIHSSIVSVGQHRTEDAAYFEEKAKDMGIEVVPYQLGKMQFYRADIIVDCLLGTGFTGDVRRPYSDAIDEINASNAYILSADINSGMNGDSGCAEKCVVPNQVATIGFIKRGLITKEASKYVNKITCLDIGIRLQVDEWLLCNKSTYVDTLKENEIQWPDGVDIAFLDVSNATIHFE